MEKNEKREFSDILLYKEGKKLHTDIFYKETRHTSIPKL